VQEAQLPQFADRSQERGLATRLRWLEIQQEVEARRAKREKRKAVILAVLISSAFTFVTAMALRGAYMLPGLQLEVLP
jgi:hypothetical protein